MENLYMRYVQFESSEELKIISVFGSPQDEQYWPNQGVVEDNDPRYMAFIDPGSTVEGLAEAARMERDSLLRSVYDPGINMALRALRMATTPEEQSYAEGKVIELDNYAQALEDIPEQPGFPQAINWPTAPTK